MNDNTRDLSKFGMRELAIAGDLLREYSNNTCDFLTDGVTVEFNPNSGVVFLTDDDFNVGVLEEGNLVQFFSCPECGEEGTEEEFNSGDIEDHKVVDGQVEHKEPKQ